MKQRRVVIAGGGIGGLCGALALARAGRSVVLVERDAVPDAASADEAFARERPGAPQVHQTHGFLARMGVLLAERFPDVLRELRSAGCPTMSGVAALGAPQPGDEQLGILLARRSTLEWVLRRAVAREASVELRGGSVVTALLPASASTSTPTVAGVLLDDGSSLEAAMVVAATGRRDGVASWLEPLGVAVPETVRPSGLMYLTRWYRGGGGAATPPAPKLGGDLGYLKFLVVPGDGDMLSATLAVPTDDAELRRALAEPDRFDATCRLLPGPDEWFGELDPEPASGVLPMGGLINRIRRFAREDGTPSVLNFHAVGDAHTCTNPLYGRGCALALLQAVLLADATDADDDPTARATAYEAACRREVEPWWRHAVDVDRSGADPGGSDAAEAGARDRVRAVMAAGQSDPVIGRAMAKLWNLLTLPSELDADPAFVARAAEIMADPVRYPAPVPDGPTRAQLLGALARVEARHEGSKK